MRLAVLMANTDESDFAQNHPKDGEKFSQMIQWVREEWQTTSFSVKDNVFPQDFNQFDGVMISGSPASVHDKEPWISRLLEVIRELYADNVPIFGACFGHQAISVALGGVVGDNPGGWVFGLTELDVIDQPVWMEGVDSKFRQYAAHVEQVSEMPKDACVLMRSDECPIAGFAISDRVYTTQNHPEMSENFIASLVEEYSDKMPADVIGRARTSLESKADSIAFAETIARFFENAKSGRSAA